MVFLTFLSKAEQALDEIMLMRGITSFQGHQGRPLSSGTNTIPRLISVVRLPLNRNKTRLATGNVLAVLSAAFLPNLESRSPEGLPELPKVTNPPNK